MGSLERTSAPDSEDLPWDVAIESSGKIVVVGHTYPPSPSAIAIARYRTNGALDPTFSGDGKKTSLKGFFAYGAALDADGRLLVVGLSGSFTARYLLG